MSNDAKIFIRRGIAKTQSKEYPAAIEYFTKALEADPSSVEAFMERIYAKLELKEYKSADEDIALGNTLFPNLSKGVLLFDEANQCYQSGKFAEAIVKYDALLQLLPAMTNIYYLRGYAKRMLEDHKGAMEDFSKAILEDASNKAAAYFQRGRVKVMLRDDKGALKDYTRAIELSPNEEEYYRLRGGIQDDEKAIADFTKAIELNPSNAYNHWARAINYLIMEDHEAACDDLTLFLKKSPSNDYYRISEAPYLRGRTMMHMLNIQGAIDDWTKAIEVNPENSDAYFNRAIVYESQGRIEESKSDFAMVEKLKNRNDPQ